MTTMRLQSKSGCRNGLRGNSKQRNKQTTASFRRKRMQETHAVMIERMNWKNLALRRHSLKQSNARKTLMTYAFNRDFLNLKERASSFETRSIDVEIVSENEGQDWKGVLSAAALISGSAVGAGILALPAETHAAGFTPSACVMLACSGMLYVEANLIASMCVEMNRKECSFPPGENSKLKEGSSLVSMSRNILGPLGGGIVSLIYFFLYNTLLTAYISKAASLLAESFGISPFVSTSLFVISFGGLLLSDKTKVDSVNGLLTSIMISAFIAVLCLGGAEANFTQLQSCDWSVASQTIPVTFLALVFHDLVPVICQRLEYNDNKIKKAILLGSLLPLVMFLGWEAVALGLTAGLEGEVDPVGFIKGSGVGGPLTISINLFSAAAIATSMIGTCLPAIQYVKSEIYMLFDDNKEIEDEFIDSKKVSKSILNKRGALRGWTDSSLYDLAILAIVLFPASKTAMDNPDVFLSAAKLAGAYGSTFMYGCLPPLMAIKLMSSNPNTNDDGDRRMKGSGGREQLLMGETEIDTYIPGGIVSCITLCIAACGIAVGQMAITG